jgi:CubicO group peptidase (beta-lactamase class C family)
MRPSFVQHILCVVLVSAIEQHALGQSQFPQTPEGILASAFVETVNSGDTTLQRNFITSRVSERALKYMPAETWLSLMQKLFQQSNGLQAMNIVPEGSGILNVTVRSRRGNHWTRLVLISSRAQPDKLANVFVLPTLDPVVEERSRFPMKKMSEEEIIRTIEERVRLRDSADIFSGVVLVAKGDRILFHKAYGMAEQSYGVLNNRTTKFHLGSMDKMFTGIAIAQLVQAGKLSFNDTLATILPQFPNKELARKATIHQLLTHTAGTGDFISNPDFRAHRESFKRTDDYLPLVARESLLFEPGSRWSYSNSGYVILGAVIEKLSGESYFDYVRKHIFKIAEMENTGYYELNEVVSNRATGYLRDAAEDPFGIDPRRSNIMFIPFKGNSAGGGYSTAIDLFKFSRALQRHELLNAELTRVVTTGKVDMIGAPRPQKYGYGFASRTVNRKEVRGMGGGGAGSGVNSSLEMFWDGSYTVIVLSNYDPAGLDLNNEICEFLSQQ